MDLFKRRLEFLFIPTGTFQPAIDDLNVLTVIWEPEASKSEKKKSSRRSTLSLLRNSGECWDTLEIGKSGTCLLVRSS